MKMKMKMKGEMGKRVIFLVVMRREAGIHKHAITDGPYIIG